MAAVTPQLLYLSLLPVVAVSTGAKIEFGIGVGICATTVAISAALAWCLSRRIRPGRFRSGDGDQVDLLGDDEPQNPHASQRRARNGSGFGEGRAFAYPEGTSRHHHKSGGVLLGILNDVLDFSKMEAGKLQLEDAESDLGNLARGAHATFASVAEAKGLAFDLHQEVGARGLYRGDPVRVRPLPGFDARGAALVAPRAGLS